jgi:hypothetical protein
MACQDKSWYPWISTQGYQQTGLERHLGTLVCKERNSTPLPVGVGQSFACTCLALGADCLPLDTLASPSPTSDQTTNKLHRL